MIVFFGCGCCCCLMLGKPLIYIVCVYISKEIRLKTIVCCSTYIALTFVCQALINVSWSVYELLRLYSCRGSSIGSSFEMLLSDHLANFGDLLHYSIPIVYNRHDTYLSRFLILRRWDNTWPHSAPSPSVWQWLRWGEACSRSTQHYRARLRLAKLRWLWKPRASFHLT